MVELPKNNKPAKATAVAGFKAWVNRHPIWTIILTIIAFAFVVSLFSGDGSNAPTTTTSSQQTQIQQPQLELKSIRYYRSGNYFYSEGEIKNIGNQSLKFVEPTVTFRDKQNDLISSEHTYLATDALIPGQTSTFKISTNYNSSIVLKNSTIKFIGRIGGSSSDIEIPYQSDATPSYQTTTESKPTAPSSQPTSIPTQAPSVPTPPVQVPITPKSWHTVTTFSGSAGQKNTDTFTTQGAQWRINWTAIATNSYCLSSGCYFRVGIIDPSKDYGWIDSFSADISGSKNDMNNFYKSGTFYLDVSGSSIDSWSLTIEDYY